LLFVKLFKLVGVVAKGQGISLRVVGLFNFKEEELLTAKIVALSILQHSTFIQGYHRSLCTCNWQEQNSDYNSQSDSSSSSDEIGFHSCFWNIWCTRCSKYGH
jgi:hypothetical protein